VVGCFLSYCVSYIQQLLTNMWWVVFSLVVFHAEQQILANMWWVVLSLAVFCVAQERTQPTNSNTYGNREDIYI
jgi:hypothetical protein